MNSVNPSAKQTDRRQMEASGVFISHSYSAPTERWACERFGRFSIQEMIPC